VTVINYNNQVKAKQLILLCIFAIAYCTPLQASKIDSLLQVLDKAINNRTVYLDTKIRQIDSIKDRLRNHSAAKDRYEIQNQLIFEYQTLNCDSSLAYIGRNIAIAKQLNDQKLMTESQVKLAFVLSISGLFTQASESTCRKSRNTDRTLISQ